MKKVYFFIGMLLCSAGVWGQISITTPGVPVTQNFDAMLGTSATAALTTNQWRAASNTGGTTWAGANLTATTQLGGTLAAVASGGCYNYGDGAAASATDRALGFLSSGTAPWPGTTATPLSIYAQYNNATGSTISQIDGTFDIEKYRNGNNAQGFSINFYYSLDGSTWTAVASGNQSFAANANNLAVNPATTTAKTFSLTGLSISNASNFYLRWSYLVTSGVTATNAQGLAIDNISVTATAAVAPNITVTPSTLSGFSSLSGVPSTEQTYTVAGSNLTNDIIITPPIGFQISLTTAVGFITNPTTITLTQSGGTVATTTIYVRMNSATLGVNSGNITLTSTGATTQNVALTGNVLAPEPTTQSTITIGAVTNSTVVVNFSGGNGARRILLAKQTSAVSNNPVDGTTYTASATFGSGTQIGAGNYVVYDGTGNTQLVQGLTAGATYHFAIYEYNNGGVAGAENYLVPGGTGNATLLTNSLSYVWVGLNGDWQVPVNWAPARLFPATNDSLLFISNLTDTIINIPTQTIGYIGVSLATNATFQAAASGNILTVGNLTGTDLSVAAGSSLNIASANALTINLVTGATASINGAMTFTAAAHKLTAVDASAVTFNSGAVFTAGTGFSGNSFGTTNLGSIIFANGSRYDQITGSNPFGAAAPSSVLTFQSGSLFRVIGNNFSPSFSGRTFANVEFAGTGTSTMTGGSAVTMDNLTITSGIVNINMTATPGHSVKGNITIASGATLNFNPLAAGTFNLNGTTAQSITNSGTLSFGALQSLTINNAAGVTLNSNITLGTTAVLTLTSGILKLTPSTTVLTLSLGTTTPGASNTSYVDGKVKKIGNTTFTFPVGKTGFGYVPIGISNFAGSTVSDEFTAEYKRGNARLLGPVTAPNIIRVSGCDYWTLDKGIATPTSLDVTGYWSTNNGCSGVYIDDLTKLEMVHFDGTNWDNSSFGFHFISGTSTTTAGDITWIGVTTFSPFSLGSTNAVANPLPITINYFTGTKQNGNHLLNWKVTCNTTAHATMVMERSSDGRNFSSIYSIYATALRCQQPFNYTDNQPAAGVNYYRLKMTDADGKISYSSIVSLINATKGFDVMNIAPNPIVNSSFNLKVSAAQNAQMQIVITDMQGRVMQQQTTSLVAGFNAIPMSVTNLARGTYQVYGITADGKSRVLRFVVQ